MNTVAKGRRTQNKVIEILRNKKFLSDAYSAPRIRFSKNTDIFNMFDIVGLFKCVNVNEDKIIIPLFMQIKSNRSDYYSTKKILVNWLKSKPELQNFFCFLILYEGKNKPLRLYEPISNTTFYLKE